MFDGNYRSQRRAVNLSGKRKNTSKEAVLEQARIRREERRLLAAQQEASTKIQRLFRGGAVREVVARQWTHEIQQLVAAAAAPPAAAVEDRVTLTLNALLGLKTATRNPDQILSILQQYASYVGTLPPNQTSRSQRPRGHRIVWFTLQHLNSAGRQLTPHQTATILSYCLDIPLQQQDTPPEKAPGGYYSDRVDERGFMLLVETYCNTPSLDPELKAFLFKCVRFTTPDNTEGRALQAVLAIMTTTTAVGALFDGDSVVSDLLQVLLQGSAESSLLTGTVHRLVAQHLVTILQAAVQQYRSSSDGKNVADVVQLLRILLLQNLEDDGTASARISLLWTLNRVVRGDSLESTAIYTVNGQDNATTEEDSDEDDDDEDALRAHTTNVTIKTNKSPSYRLTKYELQTVPKLDRLFASQVKSANDMFTFGARVDDKIKSLATSLSDSALWLHWGKILLSTTDGDAEMEETEGSSTSRRQAQESFVKVLAIMLQGTTGLRPGQNASSSTLVNKLAFSSDFLGYLWSLIVREMGESKASASDGPTYTPSSSSPCLYYALSLFSDLFAHNLIALKDEQFLENHTTRRESSVSILAENVILRLQTFLYELYWTKPVRAADFKLILGEGSGIATNPNYAGVLALTEDEQFSAARARLLLTGTKLWNSLYERWCRLVRPAPFCGESTWVFPSMVSLSGDNAVSSVQDGTSNRRGGTGRGMNDAMDVDDDSLSDSDTEDEDDHQVADPETEALAEAFSDPKMARVLASIPQALPFDRRVKLFDSLLRAEKSRTQDEEADMHQAMLAMMRGRENAFEGRERVEIHRDRLYEDSMRQLNQLGPKLKRKVQVSFINQHGAQEAGIDGGGVFKEFIDDLIRDAFTIEDSTAEHQLFSVTPLQTLKVNTDLPQDQSLLVHYEFLGRVLGKAVYESILVEPQFCLPFLNQLLGRSNSMEDLKNYDPEYYRNLAKLLSLSAADLGSMGLTFEMTVGTGAISRTVELMPGGRNIEVTKHNVVQYIHLVSHQRMNVQSARQTRAFLTGFRDLIPASWVRLFSAYELQKIISGDDSVKGIDVASLKQAMQYAAGYHPDQLVVEWFWEIVEEMTAEQQQKFLKFMTSCSRQPLLGFGSLEPAPCVQQIRLPDALFHQEDEQEIIKQTPLPTSSTCMNLLKLPNYRSKELMRRKLLAAVESGAGFELT